MKFCCDNLLKGGKEHIRQKEIQKKKMNKKNEKNGSLKGKSNGTKFCVGALSLA